MGPTDMETLYPRFFISGRSIEPSIAVLAMVEPLVAAKIVPLRAARRLNRPGMRLSHRSSTSMVLKAILEWNMSSPMRMNMGTGARANVEMEEYMCRVTFCRPAEPMKISIPSRSMRRKEKATGNPDMRKISRPKIKKIRITHHSISEITSRS
jgi:hypothetical protein